MTDLHALYAELRRREREDARIWSLFADLDFVNYHHPAQALAEEVAAAMSVPISNKLRHLLREVMARRGIVRFIHSGNVVYRHADWRRLTREQREHERLDAMDPIDRRIRELTEARKRTNKAT